jgi:phosphoglycolate phosphatase-like HAD superfamily hydrolase
MRLVLFDVDGTLISTKGAGMRAFYRALDSVFGISVDREVIRPDGKTDPLIFKELLAYFNLADRWNEDIQETLFSSYLGCLENEMSRAKEHGLIRILPGAAALLEKLSSQPDFAVGLVTGNLERGARIKLDKAGIYGYFRFGGYGSDSEDRTELTRIGIERGARAVAPESIEGTFVIGDTPLDINHGHAAGASVIAVASARYSMDDLRMHKPDLLVADLTQTDSIISFMRDFP